MKLLLRKPACKESTKSPMCEAQGKPQLSEQTCDSSRKAAGRRFGTTPPKRAAVKGDFEGSARPGRPLLPPASLGRPLGTCLRGAGGRYPARGAAAMLPPGRLPPASREGTARAEGQTAGAARAARCVAARRPKPAAVGGRRAHGQAGAGG